MSWRRRIARSLLSLATLAATAGPGVADVHPNTQGGFPVEQAFSVGQIDNVNLFNGSLVVTVPLGQSYPVAAGLSYQLSLVYNQNSWEYSSYSPGGGIPDFTQAIPNRCSNAGLGWRLSFGRLSPPCVNVQLGALGNTGEIYVGPDGAEHILYATLHEGDADEAGDSPTWQNVLYARDGSYLRLRRIAIQPVTGAQWELEFPNGQVHQFDTTGRLVRMRDPFNNQVNVSYATAGQWVITDSVGRTHRVYLRSDLPGFAESIDRVELMAFGSQTAVYTFAYGVQSIYRSCPHNDAAMGLASVPLLLAIGRPDGSAYQMSASDYISSPPVGTALCTSNSGTLTGLSLPTLGWLEWTYQDYRFPDDSSRQGWRTKKPGVATRTMRDPGGAVLGTWSYATGYQGQALVNSVTNPLGQRTERFYSASTALALTGWFFGRVYREQQSLPGSSFNLRETLYDAAGNKASVSELQTGSITRRTQFLSYDPFGRPRTIRPADGAAHDVAMSYFGTRQMERTVQVAAGAGGAEVAAKTTEMYDRHGRLVQVFEPSGAGGAQISTSYAYDVNNQLSQASTFDGTTTQTRVFHYDRAGLLEWEQHPEKGTAGNGTVTYSGYDSRGHLLGKVDGANDLSYFYDAVERLTLVRETGGACRSLKTFTYAGSNGTGDWRKGKLFQQSRFNYTTVSGSPFAVELRETFTYGGRDGRASARKLENFVNGATTPSEAFNLGGLLYDPLGNVQQLDYPQCIHAACTAPTPRTVVNSYSEGLLTAVGIPGTPGYYASSISYHPNLMVNQVVHTNNPADASKSLTDTQANDPNAMRRPASIAVTTPTGTVRWSTGAYSYDGTGNVKAIGTHTFGYDKVSRLTSANLYLEPTISATAASQSFTYDAFGNLQSIAGTAGRTTPTSSATNRLTGGVYDAAGNVTSWNGNLYEYGPFNQMSRYKTPADEWVYLYTADDERAWAYKIGGTDSRWYLRDLGGQILREYASTGGWKVETDTIYRGGLLLAAETSKGIRHFHLDHLGTPRLISDNLGQQKAYHVYYPYGEEATALGQDSLRTKFTGHERDLANPAGAGDDLDYMHARFFSPVVGRFLSVDIGTAKPAHPQTWNRYSYALDNSLRYVDPDGLEPIDAPMRQFLEAFLKIDLSDIDLKMGFEGDYVSRLAGASAVTIAETIYLSTDSQQDYQQKTSRGIALLGHELVHTLDYQRLGTARFLATYLGVDSLKAVQDPEGTTAGYKKISFEVRANNVQDMMSTFLEKNPDIANSLKEGKGLASAEKSRVEQYVIDQITSGKLKAGFQFISGSLYYMGLVLK